MKANKAQTSETNSKVESGAKINGGTVGGAGGGTLIGTLIIGPLLAGIGTVVGEKNAQTTGSLGYGLGCFASIVAGACIGTNIVGNKEK